MENSAEHANHAQTFRPKTLDDLPDLTLLAIFNYLTDVDLFTLRKVSPKFESFTRERRLAKNVSFNGCYKVSSFQMVVKYLQPIKKRVESLNLNYCYWLSSRCFDTVMRCTSLVDLQLLHISLSDKRLVNLLASLKKLQQLSATIENVKDFHTSLDKNQQAKETMRGLRVLTIQVKQQPITSFFEDCPNLEEFHVLGLFCIKIKRSDSQENNNTANVNNATVDTSTLGSFLGALPGICRLPELRFQTLLQPLAFREQLEGEKKDHFDRCIKQVEHLENLDISKTDAVIPDERYLLDRAVQLQYLNVAGNRLIDSQSLHALADNCHQLISINLRGCRHLHFQRPQTEESGHEQVDMSGLQSLVVNCTALCHINISGVHIHSEDLADTDYTSLCHLLACNTEWRSISVSPCCLYPRSGETSRVPRETRRSGTVHRGGRMVNRFRFGAQRPDLNMSQEQELSTELGKLVSACPDVEQFELIGAGFRSAFSEHYVPENLRHFVSCPFDKSRDEEDILCIRHWTRLRYLQLSAVPGINSGESLLAIVRGCPKLERLLVAHLGLSPMSVFQDKLQLGLPLAENLKDLRIEQSHLNLKESFWEALGKMNALERVCILSKNSAFTQSTVEQFVQKVPSLAVLQLYMNNTVKDCFQLKTSLVNAHKEQRPAFSVRIFPLSNTRHRPLLSIPDFHKESLTILSSTICMQPPRWDSAS